MRLTLWIVTEITPTNPQAARELVARRTRIEVGTLNAVALREDLTDVPEEVRRRLSAEKYLGPLEKYSPVLRASCSFCRGTGKTVGSMPPVQCSICAGSGVRTVRRT